MDEKDLTNVVLIGVELVKEKIAFYTQLVIVYAGFFAGSIASFVVYFSKNNRSEFEDWLSIISAIFTLIAFGLCLRYKFLVEGYIDLEQEEIDIIQNQQSTTA